MMEEINNKVLSLNIKKVFENFNFRLRMRNKTEKWIFIRIFKICNQKQNNYLIKYLLKFINKKS